MYFVTNWAKFVASSAITAE